MQFATDTFQSIRLTAIAAEYAKRNPHLDRAAEAFVATVENSKFTWGGNDATFARLDRFCDAFPVAAELLEGQLFIEGMAVRTSCDLVYVRLDE